MRRIDVLPSRERGAGLVDSDPLGVAVAVGEDRATLILDRTSWPEMEGQSPESEVLRAQIWLSFDGGATWELRALGGMDGGDWYVDANGKYSQDPAQGELLMASFLWVHLREPRNPNRRVRMHCAIRTRLTTAAHFELSTQGVR